MATQNTPAPTPTANTTPCHFAGMPSCTPGQVICPHGTPATLDVQVGSPGQSRVDHFKTCKSCATRMSEVRNARMVQKRAGHLPNDEVLDVIVANSAKVDFFAHAAQHNGEGLVARTTASGFPACSGKHWDDGPCPNNVGGKAIAYQGVKHELCKSCEVAAGMVAVRDKNKLGFKLTPLITPLPAKIAATRAKRQADELAEAAKRQKKLKPDATPQPQTTGATAVDFEAFVLAPNARTEPVRRLG